MMLMSSTGSNVKVSTLFEACSNHIELIESLASRTLSIKIFMLRIKFISFLFLSACQDKVPNFPIILQPVRENIRADNHTDL